MPDTELEEIDPKSTHEAVVKVARAFKALDKVELLEDFTSDLMLSWIDHQSEDVEAFAPTIRSAAQHLHGDTAAGQAENRQIIEAAISRLNDLADRSARLANLKSDALRYLELRRLISDAVTEYKSKVDRFRQNPNTDEGRALVEQVDEMTHAAEEISDLHARLKEQLTAQKMSRVLQVAQAGARPVRDVLAAQADKAEAAAKSLHAAERAATPAPIEPSTPKQDPPPPPSSSPKAPPSQAGDGANPLLAQRKKELGRPLEAMSIEGVSKSFFARLWIEGADPDRVGEILFFIPAASRGISVHDLLSVSNGQSILDQAIPEILARFPAEVGPANCEP